MKEVEIRRLPGKRILIIILGIGFLVVFSFLLPQMEIDPFRPDCRRHCWSPLIIYFLGFPYMVYVVINNALALKTNRPSMVINKDGIEIHRFGVGKIPWNEISGYEVSDGVRGTGDFLAGPSLKITLKNYEQWKTEWQRKHSPLKRTFYKFRFKVDFRLPSLLALRLDVHEPNTNHITEAIDEGLAQHQS